MARRRWIRAVTVSKHEWGNRMLSCLNCYAPNYRMLPIGTRGTLRAAPAELCQQRQRKRNADARKMPSVVLLGRNHGRQAGGITPRVHRECTLPVFDITTQRRRGFKHCLPLDSRRLNSSCVKVIVTVVDVVIIISNVNLGTLGGERKEKGVFDHLYNVDTNPLR